MKKDIFLRILRVIIGLSLMWYSWFLYKHNYIIANYFTDYNLIFLWFVFLLGLFIFLMGIFMPCLPKMRLIQFLFWCFLILIWYFLFKNEPKNYIYVGDFLRILWALLVILGPLGICKPNKCEQKEKEEKIEIIEV